MYVSIKKRLLKDPIALTDDILSQIDDEASRASVSNWLKEAQASVLLQSSIISERKGLSRQIGQAKKANQDCSDLISQVSDMSDRLTELSDTIDQNVSLIEAELTKEIKDNHQDASDHLPRHMREILPNEDDASLKLSLSTSHSEDVDWQQWQSFVDATQHSTIYHDARWKTLNTPSTTSYVPMNKIRLLVFYR